LLVLLGKSVARFRGGDPRPLLERGIAEREDLAAMSTALAVSSRSQIASTLASRDNTMRRRCSNLRPLHRRM